MSDANQTSQSLDDAIADLERSVSSAFEILARLSEHESELRPAPNKWSRKEIIGHLIDSAANNHARFVRARSRDDLVFEGYDQDAWIAAQNCRGAPWANLLALWRSYNLHIAHVMRSTPRAVLEKAHARHSLDKIAWQTVPAHEPATLAYLMRDYIGHLKHHLRQTQAL